MPFNPLVFQKSQKYELIKGDAVSSVERYFQDHPETIVSLAYFDFDIYAPTVACLKAIKDRLTKGSVIGFDELNNRDCPGETLALKEVLGLGSYRIRHSRFSPAQHSLTSSLSENYLVRHDLMKTI